MSELLVQSLQTSLLMLGICLCLPLFSWCFSPEGGFFRRIGLIRPHRTAPKWLAVVLCIACVPLLFSFDIALTGKGLQAILPALMIAFLADGLAEELLFRGYITGRLARNLSCNIAILIQAVLYGLLHLALAGAGGANLHLLEKSLFFMRSTCGALALGMLDWRCFGGSIVPSVFVRSCISFAAAIFAALL